MKILTVLGSPKRSGNTSIALNILESEISRYGHEIERVCVVDYKINGCVGCNVCIKEKHAPNCVQHDDAMKLFDRILSSDLIVYASPLYAHSYPAQMKALIDRHYCFVTEAGLPNQSSVIEGKNVALLITCCYLEETTDLIQESFDRIFTELKCNITGKIIVAESAAKDFPQRAEGIIKNMTKEIIKSK